MQIYDLQPCWSAYLGYELIKLFVLPLYLVIRFVHLAPSVQL